MIWICYPLMSVLWRMEALRPMEHSFNPDGRWRIANGEIDRKHGNTLVRTLRGACGRDLAEGSRVDMKLSRLQIECGVDSLSQCLKGNR